MQGVPSAVSPRPLPENREVIRVRTAHRVDWADPKGPVVAACLTVPCKTCGAKPDHLCTSTVPGQVLLRTVHHWRLDKILGKETK